MLGGESSYSPQIGQACNPRFRIACDSFHFSPKAPQLVPAAPVTKRATAPAAGRGPKLMGQRFVRGIANPLMPGQPWSLPILQWTHRLASLDKAARLPNLPCCEPRSGVNLFRPPFRMILGRPTATRAHRLSSYDHFTLAKLDAAFPPTRGRASTCLRVPGRARWLPFTLLRRPDGQERAGEPAAHTAGDAGNRAGPMGRRRAALLEGR